MHYKITISSFDTIHPNAMSIAIITVTCFFLVLITSQINTDKKSFLFENLTPKYRNAVPSALRFFLRKYQQNKTNVDIVVRYINDDSWKYKFEFLDEFLPEFDNLSVRLDLKTSDSPGLETSEPRSYYVLLLDDVKIFQEIITNLSATKYDDIGKFYVYFLGSEPDRANDTNTLDIIFPIALQVRVVDLVVLVRRHYEIFESVEVHTCFPFNEYCGLYSGTRLGRYIHNFNANKGIYYYFKELRGNEFFQKKYNKNNHCPLNIAVTHVVPFMIVNRSTGINRKKYCRTRKKPLRFPSIQNDDLF